MGYKRKKAFVYLRESKAGLLEKTERGYRFSYSREYLSTQDAEPVSLTLPLTDEPYESERLFPYFNRRIFNNFYKQMTNMQVLMKALPIL
jgi:HipA-like protein